MAKADSRNLRKYPPILFDEVRRREFIDPEIVVDLVNVNKGELIGDLGAGAGFFTVPMAKAVGDKGQVYAVDINANNLSIIKGKASHAKVGQRIELVEGNVESRQGLGIAPNSLDVVILSSVLSQFAGKQKVLGTAKDLLKPKGRLVIVEWHQRDMLLGPPPSSRIAKEEVINLIFHDGRRWTLRQDVDAGFYHYCLIFAKA